MRVGAQRVLFVLTALWGVGIIWLAPHPPMIDLPQHAGQVAVFKQLVSGAGSRWEGLLQLNLLNPYMIGYWLALPLAFVLPVSAALKLLLSIAYASFVWMSVLMRRRFGADARLDWLSLCSFFGFAYEWGFLTFIVAAPIGLAFILFAESFSRRPDLRRGLGLTGLGLLVLCSHGLVFLFTAGAGGALLLARAPGLQAFARRCWPYLLLGLLSVAFFVLLRQRAAGYPIQATVPAVNWHFGIRYEILAFSFSMIWTHWAAAASLIFLAAPWAMGLGIDWRRTGAWPYVAVLCAILAFVPHFVAETAFTYQRFALFLLPAYACLFAARSQPVPDNARASWTAAPMLYAVIAACWCLHGLNSVKSWEFGRESAQFDQLAARIEPGQRALALVYDRASDAAGGRNFYVHYPAWYQAEHQGFVDFNFAWFYVMVARFRPDALPGVYPDIAWKPERFDWQRQRGDEYRYFFVRSRGDLPADPFKGAPCRPRLLARSGIWMVFERSACALPGPAR